MKYFLHDTNSFSDEKITVLFMNFGYEGLGLFYTTLEKLAMQEKPVKTTVLKSQLKVGKRLNKCWEFMEEIGLISSNNGETFNKQLLNYSEKYQIKKEKNRKRVSQWRENQEVVENVTHYEQVRNTPKVKESKVNNNNKAFKVDANVNLKEYRLYLHDLIKEKAISRDQLFAKCRIDLERRQEIWESFINNSIENVPRIEDDKHAWNTFKKYINDNCLEWQEKVKSNFDGF